MPRARRQNLGGNSILQRRINHRWVGVGRAARKRARRARRGEHRDGRDSRLDRRAERVGHIGTGRRRVLQALGAALGAGLSAALGAAGTLSFRRSYSRHACSGFAVDEDGDVVALSQRVEEFQRLRSGSAAAQRGGRRTAVRARAPGTVPSRVQKRA